MSALMHPKYTKIYFSFTELFVEKKILCLPSLVEEPIVIKIMLTTGQLELNYTIV